MNAGEGHPSSRAPSQEPGLRSEMCRPGLPVSVR